MTNSKKIFSFILIVFITLVFITGVLIYTSFINTTRITPYSIDTYVGNVYIGGLNERDAIKQLELETKSWKDNASIKLDYQGYRIDIDLSKLTFESEKSIRTVKDGKKKNESTKDNIIIANINDEDYLANLITEHKTIIKIDDFNLNTLEKEIIRYASYLYSDIIIDLGAFINDELLLEAEVNQIEFEFADAVFLENKINYILDEPIEIRGNTQFSLNDWIISNYTTSTIFSEEELNLLATGIYQLFLESNFRNLSKQISKEKPNYIIDAGYEAISKIEINQVSVEGELTYEYVNLIDLSFYNPNGNSYYIKITDGLNDANKNVLKFTLFGAPFINSHELEIESTDMIQDETIRYETTWNGVQIDDDVKIPISSGRPGIEGIMYRITTTYDGKTIKEFISQDIYMPVNAIFIMKPQNYIG